MNSDAQGAGPAYRAPRITMVGHLADLTRQNCDPVTSGKFNGAADGCTFQEAPIAS